MKKLYVLKRLFLLAVVLLFSQHVLAQVSVSGTIQDEQGQALPGAAILEIGTNNGTIADSDGNYSITVNSGESVLQFSMIGMESQEIVVGNQTSINLTLETEETLLDEVVVIGYGSVKKSDLTGAVASVKSESLEKIAASNAAEALQGQVAGLSVTKMGGAPGAGFNVRIRGMGTINNNNPLYIVDGLPGNLSLLNPDDIASIEVLKDGAAAAIYGSRAANGVVIVTTKKGSGAPSVEYNMYMGSVTQQKQYEMLDAEGYRNYHNQLATAGGAPVPDFVINPITNYANTDWQEEAMQSALHQKHNLRVSGSNELAHYSISGSTLNEEGSFIGSAYKQNNLLMNTGITKGRLNVDLSASYAENFYEPVKFAIREIYELSPLIPVLDDAAPSGYGISSDGMPGNKNVVGMDHFNEENTATQYFTGNLNARFRIFDGFHIQTKLGLRNSNISSFSYSPQYQVDSKEAHEYVELSDGHSNWREKTMENLLSYEKTFGEHNLSLLAGFTATEQTSEWLTGSVAGKTVTREVVDGSIVETVSEAGFLSPDFRTLDAGTGGTYNATGSEYGYTRNSVLGRLAYNYAGKYYLQATARRDGSSKFGTDSRYGFFPSVALGWTISRESFMQDIDALSNLKIRASWGRLGNEESLGYYDHRVLITTDNYYRWAYVQGASRNVWVGSIAQGLENKNLRWEVNESANLGLDFSLFDFRLDGSINYFNNHTRDMLIEKLVPPSSGVPSPVVNVGEVKNTGLELDLGYRNNDNAFKYEIRGSLATLKNEVLELSTDDQELVGGGLKFGASPYTTVIKEGYPIGAFFLYETDGIFQNQGEVDTHNAMGADGPLQEFAEAGDIRFRDSNGDGYLDEADKVYMGSGLPKYEYSLTFNASFSGFDFSMMWYGAGGHKLINGNRYLFESLSSGFNQFTTVENAWTSGSGEDEMPRITPDDPNENKRVSDRWLESGDFLRLKNLQLGYTLPASLTKRVSIERIRLYVSAQNLLTITNYSGLDPEIGRGSVRNTGVDGSFYPMTKTMLFGVQVSF
jgi:TonB-dependent starch-binding outer membrane protein SusC